MPYFSFIFKNKNLITTLKEFGDFDENIKYYSKNTKLWSYLKKLSKNSDSIHLTQEKRKNASRKFKSILFCLPPNIGLGDAIEYSLAIKSIQNENPNKLIGVAHVGKYKDIFINYYNIEVVYDYLTEKDLLSFDSVFHFTFEIKELIFQKYDRKNIEKIITDYFKVPLYRKKLNVENNQLKTNIISIFPISQSPLRSLPIYILNSIINNFVNDYEIEIYLDSKSDISNYIKNNINFKNKLIFYDPINLNDLINFVKKIQFGIFPDSGPLHLAKIFNKKGILFTSSVPKEILINEFNSISAIESFYRSEFCNGPCGLVNSFEYKGRSGCYDSLSIFKNQIMALKNIKNLQRGDLKKNQLNLYVNSVNCYKYYNADKINAHIKKYLEKK